MVGIGNLPSVHEAHDIVYVGQSLLTSTLTIVGGTIAGASAGLIASWSRHRASRFRDSTPPGDSLDEQQISPIAADWAATHGRIGDEQLVVDKLRLFRQLQQRRLSRRGWLR